MNYPAAELRGIKMNFYLINPDAEHRGILSINPVYGFSPKVFDKTLLATMGHFCNILDNLG